MVSPLACSTLFLAASHKHDLPILNSIPNWAIQLVHDPILDFDLNDGLNNVNPHEKRDAASGKKNFTLTALAGGLGLLSFLGCFHFWAVYRKDPVLAYLVPQIATLSQSDPCIPNPDNTYTIQAILTEVIAFVTAKKGKWGGQGGQAGTSHFFANAVYLSARGTAASLSPRLPDSASDGGIITPVQAK